MKINFTKLNVGNDTLKLDIDFGNGFNPVSISTIKENNNSIEIPENTDLSKIKIKGKTSFLKDLDYLKSVFIVKNEGDNEGGNEEYNDLFYWGSAALPETFTSAFILALTGKKFATNYKGSYDITVGSGEYGFIACPASWNIPNSCKIGGFATDLVDCGSISFTNSSGASSLYKIVRTNISGLGTITMVFE